MPPASDKFSSEFTTPTYPATHKCRPNIRTSNRDLAPRSGAFASVSLCLFCYAWLHQNVSADLIQASNPMFQLDKNAPQGTTECSMTIKRDPMSNPHVNATCGMRLEHAQKTGYYVQPT
ncbi:unnamed protein product [Ectocarpus sp. 12 AP-2014]